MQVWEAHRDVSLAVGDSIGLETLSAAPATSIPDGARFTSAHRNSALYRAMLTILQDAQRALGHLPRPLYVENMVRLFPTLVVPYLLEFAGIKMPVTSSSYQLNTYKLSFDKAPKPFSILTLEAIHRDSNVTIGQRQPIPFKNSLTEARGLSSWRSTQRPDPYATYTEELEYGRLSVVDGYGEIGSTTEVWINYIPYPSLPDSSLSGLTHKLVVEDMFIPKMITLATIFLLSEAQDIESMSQFMPLTLGHVMPVGVQNANQ